MNKHLLNGVIKSEPKKWSDTDIEFLLQKKKDGYSFIDIAKKLGRTDYSCNILHKKNN